ncbi:MAG: hypothetical protein IKH38_03150, partial [Clostridia bacterium]|nr:hypothetical protein [Clostridia bacterium]
HFYVYEYTKEKTADGKWRNRTGKMIGTIVEGRGYIPNDNLLCDAEISTVEFGDYAISLANSRKTLSLLESCFNKGDAIRIKERGSGVMFHMPASTSLIECIPEGPEAIGKLPVRLRTSGRARRRGISSLPPQLAEAMSRRTS